MSLLFGVRAVMPLSMEEVETLGVACLRRTTSEGVTSEIVVVRLVSVGVGVAEARVRRVAMMKEVNFMVVDLCGVVGGFGCCCALQADVE